jgi:hypothetical protein
MRGSLREAELRARERINTPPSISTLDHRVSTWINRGASGNRRETVYHAFRLHPVVMLKWLFVDGLLGGTDVGLFVAPNIGIAAAPILLTLMRGGRGAAVAMALSILWAAVIWVYLEWRHTWFLITDRRIVRITGLFTVKADQMAIKKQTDGGTDIRWLPRLLARLRIIDGPWGERDLETAGQLQQLNKVTLVPWIRPVSDLIDFLSDPPGSEPQQVE